MFDDVVQWNECKTELKYYFIKHYVESKSHERDNKCKSEYNDQSSEHTETDKDDNSDHETHADVRFSFTRTVPDEVPLRKRDVPEHKNRNNDAISPNKECERVTANKIEHQVKWR